MYHFVRSRRRSFQFSSKSNGPVEQESGDVGEQDDRVRGEGRTAVRGHDHEQRIEQSRLQFSVRQ